MRVCYRARLWWLGLDNLDRLSLVCTVLLIGGVVGVMSFLLGVY